ncbi:MAG: hypothetical protein ACE148_05950 [Vicinamibacterales bacterium]
MVTFPRAGALFMFLLVAGTEPGTAVASQLPVPKPFPTERPLATQAAKPADAQAAPIPGGPPTEAELGLPIHPTAQYIASYDAGQGQRYHLFGTASPFGEIVAYYRSVLRQKGEIVFELPPTHMFEVGRFREDRMAFPPGVTVKDYTWGGSKGYPNPKRGTEPQYFATVIQMVAVPPEERR